MSESDPVQQTDGESTGTVTLTVPNPDWVAELTGGSGELTGAARTVRVAHWDGSTPWVHDPAAPLVAAIPQQFSMAPDALAELAAVPTLRWVWALSAGTDHLTKRLPEGVGICNAKGVHEESTADHALALTLIGLRSLETLRDAQVAGVWENRVTPAWQARNRSLHESRVLVVGYGAIGQAIARRVHACGARVTAVATTDRPGDEYVEAVHSRADLHALLPEHHVVILITPLTPETKGLIGAEEMALMPEGGLLVNVARGAVVDTDALVEACGSGRIRAAVDVTAPEPLPEGHPLFSTPGVFLTPHLAGITAEMADRQLRLVRAQLQRLADGQAFVNVVREPQ
ncbi:Phosphoglycerate dehydrogenase [Kytococcus aerolatus]|uniref:Phosphoglycerate dehydrogenase n=1 Tax=Kytococcus aerolatus TaxID=592308 RepID=A0A212U0S1_9MICO|nr:2-hydroxyacid dehydrogenase [Kytococcus aerolatus]SNC71867.1 Phosphoglycerate dehydrogenase [Kytococcus aerolatus]